MYDSLASSKNITTSTKRNKTQNEKYKKHNKMHETAKNSKTQQNAINGTKKHVKTKCNKMRQNAAKCKGQSRPNHNNAPME